MPGRRRLTTLLYAFPERTERCSFPTPSTPVLPFYSSPSSFFLRPPPSPPPSLPPLLFISLFLSLLFSSFPFPYSTRCSALPGTRHLAARTFFHFFHSSRLCSSMLCPRGTEELEKKTNHIYIYTLLFLFLLSLLFISTSYPVLSASIGTRLPKLHRLPLAHSLPSVPLLVFSAPPHNTRAIASYRIAGTSLSILPYI